MGEEEVGKKLEIRNGRSRVTSRKKKKKNKERKEKGEIK